MIRARTAIVSRTTRPTREGRPRTSRLPTRAAAVIAITVCLAVLGSCGTEVELPPGYAIVVGVSDYDHISDLDQPKHDAEAVAAMLASEGYTIAGGGAITDDTPPPTPTGGYWDEVAAAFDEVVNNAPTDSRFVFYFAGHGFGDGMTKEYDTPPFSEEWAEYLAETAGSEPGGAGSYPEFLFLRGADPFGDVDGTLEEIVSDDELAALVASVPSRQRVVIIDACHSGGFVGSASAVDTVPRGFRGYDEGTTLVDALNAMTLYLSFGARGSADVDEESAVVISAAGEQDFSYEGDYWGFPNGVFTHFFLQARTHADHNADGFITTSEAYAHASAAIQAVANDDLSGEDKFIPRTSGGAVDYILFESR